MSQGQLPPGWSSKFDQRMNRWYYINHETKTTQWEPPTMPVKFNSGGQDNRERQVNEVMEAFFGEDGYDDEMKTMVSELFNVYNDDRGQVEKQV